MVTNKVLVLSFCNWYNYDDELGISDKAGLVGY